MEKNVSQNLFFEKRTFGWNFFDSADVFCSFCFLNLGFCIFKDWQQS